MAYISNQDQQNVSGMNQKKQDELQQQQQQQEAPTLSGQSAMSSGAPQQPAQPQAPMQARPGAAPSSGAKAGFQQYQKANQGVATNRLAQSVQQNIQSSANQANRATQQAQTAFGQRMDQGTLANRQNAVADVNTAVKQASNIYTGNIEEDRAKQQQAITNAQQSIEQTRQQQQAEADRIAREQGRQQELLQKAEQAKSNQDFLNQYKVKTDGLGNFRYITNPAYQEALRSGRGPVDTNQTPMNLVQYYDFDKLDQNQKLEVAKRLGFGQNPFQRQVKDYSSNILRQPINTPDVIIPGESEYSRDLRSPKNLDAPAATRLTNGQEIFANKELTEFRNSLSRNTPVDQAALDKFLFEASLKQDNPFAQQFNQYNTQATDLQKQLDEATKLNQIADTRVTGLEAQRAKAQQALDYLSNPELRSQLDDSVIERFRDIVNAQYRGPQSLREAGLYDLAQGRVAGAQSKLDLAKRADTRQDLLNQLYKQPGTEYSRGLSGLDAALLNTSSQGIQNIVNQNRNIGNLQAELDKAQSTSEISARNRAQEIRDIVSQSKDAFTAGQKGQETLTEQAIDARQADAKAYIDQLRGAFNDTKEGQQLSAAEAAILGIREGEGLYGAGSDIVKEKQLERARLVSRDEQARLAALSRLAGLDLNKTLNTNNLYSDASKAGTQTALDALDREAVRAALVEREEDFRNRAAQTTARGVGTGKGSRGGMFGKRTVKSTKELEANVRDALQQSGAYDFGSEIQRDVLGSNDVAKNMADALNYAGTRNQTSGQVNPAVTGSITDREGAKLNAGDLAGGAVSGLGLADKNFYDALGNTVEGLKPITDLLGNTVGSLPFISGLAGGISNIFAGNAAQAKSVADQKALEAANAALQADYQNKLKELGIYDRIKIDNQNAAVQQRSAALEALLRRLG